MLSGAPLHVPDRPLPGWITPDVIAVTRATWEPLYQRRLTDDEVIEILLGVGNLFRLLRDSSPSQTKAASGNAAEAHTSVLLAGGRRRECALGETK